MECVANTVTPSTEEMLTLIYAAVDRVPRGCVVTYGQIAAMIGYPRHSRLVGRALRSLPAGSRLAWHRVINAGGKVSKRTLGDSDESQRILLEAEGVEFDDRDRVSLERYQWEDPHDRPAARTGKSALSEE